MTIRPLRFAGTLIASAAIVGCADAPAGPPAVDSRLIVETLASDELEGRLTGSEGIRKAADYLIDQLVAIGAEPLPGSDGFRLPFQYTADIEDTGTTLAASGVTAAAWAGPDVRALSFSENGSASGPLVFAGYGLSVPETDGFSYDSYATLDVTDKVVLVLRYFPEDTAGDVRGALSRYSGLRYKALAARERGASGMVVVTGPPLTERR